MSADAAVVITAVPIPARTAFFISQIPFSKSGEQRRPFSLCRPLARVDCPTDATLHTVDRTFETYPAAAASQMEPQDLPFFFDTGPKVRRYGENDVFGVIFIGHIPPVDSSERCVIQAMDRHQSRAPGSPNQSDRRDHTVSSNASLIPSVAPVSPAPRPGLIDDAASPRRQESLDGAG